MSYLDQIRDEASRIDDESMRGVCLDIVDEVARRIKVNKGGKWTLHTFSKWVKRDPADMVLQQSVFLLTQKSHTHLLDMHFLFFDLADADDIGLPIDDAEVEAAYQSGGLVDPRSGALIEEFEESLAPYFVVNPALFGNAKSEDAAE